MKPMLAHDYKKRGHNIKYPAYVQPKLDGVRALATRKGNTIIFTSRDENEFAAVTEHLTPHLINKMQDGEVWDGELYTRDMVFEDIISAVKRKQPNTQLLEYWVFDCVPINRGVHVPSLEFEDRHLHIDSRIKGKGPIKCVPTLLVDSEDAMFDCHKVMLQKGYEGTMVRNQHGAYVNKRSADLQKYKDMIDDEFKCINVGEGEGKDKGCAVLTCVTLDGKEFEARPNGLYDRRERWYKDRKNIIGKMVTVQYQGMTNGGKPRFPIAIEVRDYE